MMKASHDVYLEKCLHSLPENDHDEHSLARPFFLLSLSDSVYIIMSHPPFFPNKQPTYKPNVSQHWVLTSN